VKATHGRNKEELKAFINIIWTTIRWSK